MENIFPKMKSIFTLKLLVILALLVPNLLEAQSFYSIRRDRSLIVSGGVGVASYFGDLEEDKNYLGSKPSISVGLQYYVMPIVSIRGELSYFQLKGNDAREEDPGLRRRNLSFTSGNFELNFTGHVNLFSTGNRFYQRPAINVYGFAGIAVLYTNPKAELGGTKYALQPLQTENNKYSRFQPVIPMGFGFRVKAGPFFNVALEGGYRLTFTDYLDDVSTQHPDKSTWTDPVRIALSDRSAEIGLSPYEPGSKRGDPSNNDGYFLVNVKIEYYLPKNFLLGSRNKLYNAKRKAYYRRR